MAMTENGCIVEFYRDAVQNNFKSSQAGRPIYEERDFVRLTTPGDTKTVVVEVVSDRHQQQFPKAWDAYSRGLEEVTEGTPIGQWNQASRSQVLELAHFNVRTVEHLAGVDDNRIQQMGPGYRALRDRARQFLQASESTAASTESAREAELLRERMELLEQENEALKQQLVEARQRTSESNTEAPKRGPGRPPKQEE